MKLTVKQIVKYSLLAALSVALLYFAFRNVEWSDFVKNVKQCKFWWIVGLFFVCWLVVFLRGCRWRLLMLPFAPKLTRIEAYDGYSVCYLSNLAFPRSGEIVRCGAMAGRGHGTFEQVLGTVVLERSWDLMCTVLLAIPLLFIGRFKDYLMENLWIPMGRGFNGTKLLIIILAVAAVVILCRIFRKAILSSKVGRWCSKVWHGLVDGIKAGFKMEHKWAFFAYTAAIWFGHLMTSYMVIKAFDSLSFMNLTDSLLLMAVGSLGWIVPVPGGFGVYHNLITATLVMFYGIPEDTSLVLATISHETQVLQMFLCGIIALAHLAIAGGIRKKSSEIEITNA